MYLQQWPEVQKVLCRTTATCQGSNGNDGREGRGADAGQGGSQSSGRKDVASKLEQHCPKRTLYEAWAGRWKWVVVWNTVMRISLTYHGWLLKDGQGACHLIRNPDALMVNPIPCKWVQTWRDRLA